MPKFLKQLVNTNLQIKLNSKTNLRIKCSLARWLNSFFVFVFVFLPSLYPLLLLPLHVGGITGSVFSWPVTLVFIIGIDAHVYTGFVLYDVIRLLELWIRVAVLDWGLTSSSVILSVTYLSGNSNPFHSEGELSLQHLPSRWHLFRDLSKYQCCA